MKKFLISFSLVVTATQSMFGALALVPVPAPTAVFNATHVDCATYESPSLVPIHGVGRFDARIEEANDQRLKVVAEDQGYGYKTANLGELKRFMQDEKLQAALNALGVTAEVPNFRGISSPEIVAYLEAKGFNLEFEWARTVETITPEMQEQAFATKELPHEFALATQELGARLKNFFDEQATAIEQCGFLSRWWNYFFGQTTFMSNIASFIEDAHKAGIKFIIRSTGMEDTKKTANAGGNDSFKNVTPTMPDILRAIGKVLKSYLGTKSLGQRLTGGDTTIFRLPQTPVLVQHFVEIPSGKRPVECVVHTTEQAGLTPGLASLNCGYGVVESKERADLCYHFHTGHGHCIFAKNVEHLSKKTRKALSRIAQYIEIHYQRAIDIELLVDPAEGKIFIVQSRPVNRPASMASPSYIKELLHVPADTMIAADTVVAAGSSVRHITDKKQIISALTLAQALEIYLYHTADKDSVRAIVVQGLAEPNSHEATTFASDGKLVMIARDYEKFSQWFIDPTIGLYCDAQQEVIVASSVALVVIEGYTRHPMPGRVSVEAPESAGVAAVAAAAEALPFAITDGMPDADIATLITTLKQGSQPEAELALASLLARIDAQIVVLKSTLPAEECPLRIFITDALDRLDVLQMFAIQKAHEAYPFLALPGNDLERLAAIVPIEALLIQAEHAKAERVYSVVSVLDQLEQRKAFLEEYPQLEANLPLFYVAQAGSAVALTPWVESRWIAFIDTLQESEAQVHALLETRKNIPGNDAFAAFINSMFSEEIPVASDLLADIDTTFLLSLHEIHEQLDGINVADWEDPQKFPHLWNHFTNNILPFFLSEDFFAKVSSGSKFLKLIALSEMNNVINRFDNHFMKTLLGSSRYRGDEKVGHFKTCVQTYHDILKAWDKNIVSLEKTVPLEALTRGFIETHRSASFIEHLGEAIAGTSESNTDELQPLEKFNVARMLYSHFLYEITYGAEASIDDRIKQIERSWITSWESVGFKLAELYTIIHQNINSLLGALGTSLVPNLPIPASLKRVTDQIEELRGSRASICLIGAKIGAQSITLNYNLPLVVHGVTFDVDYNKNSDMVTLVVNYVGINSLATIVKDFVAKECARVGFNISIDTYGVDEIKFTFTFDPTIDVAPLHDILSIVNAIITERSDELYSFIRMHVEQGHAQFYDIATAIALKGLEHMFGTWRKDEIKSVCLDIIELLIARGQGIEIITAFAAQHMSDENYDSVEELSTNVFMILLANDQSKNAAIRAINHWFRSYHIRKDDYLHGTLVKIYHSLTFFEFID